MYKIGIWHLFITPSCDNHDKSSNHVTKQRCVFNYILYAAYYIHMTRLWLEACTSYSSSLFSSIPPPTSLATISLLFVFMSLFGFVVIVVVVLDYTYEWNHTIYFFFCLIYLT